MWLGNRTDDRLQTGQGLPSPILDRDRLPPPAVISGLWAYGYFSLPIAYHQRRMVSTENGRAGGGFLTAWRLAWLGTVSLRAFGNPCSPSAPADTRPRSQITVT